MKKQLKTDAKEAGLFGYNAFLYTGIILVLVAIFGTIAYSWQRSIGSNQKRDLLVNSGYREAANLVQLADLVTECEAQAKTLALRDAELAEFDSELQTQAWTIAKQNRDGVQLFVARCRGSIESILNTTELDTVPEYVQPDATTGKSLKSRVLYLLN